MVGDLPYMNLTPQSLLLLPLPPERKRLTKGGEMGVDNLLWICRTQVQYYLNHGFFVGLSAMITCYLRCAEFVSELNQFPFLLPALDLMLSKRPFRIESGKLQI